MNFGIIGYGRSGKRYEKILKSMNINTTFICDVIKPQKHKNYFKNFEMVLD